MTTLNEVYDESTDDGFYGYVETANDPGASLLIATILFTLVLNLALPCLLYVGKNYDVHQTPHQHQDKRQTTMDQDDDDENDHFEQEAEVRVVGLASYNNNAATTTNNNNNSECSSPTRVRPPVLSSSYPHCQPMTPSRCPTTQSAGTLTPDRRSVAAPSVVSGYSATSAYSAASTALSHTPSTTSSSAGMLSRSRGRTSRRVRKRTMAKRHFRDECQERMDHYGNFVDAVLNDNDNNTNNNNDDDDSTIGGAGGGLSVSSTKLPTLVPQPPTSRDHSPVRSMLGKLGIDEVSIDDAVSNYGHQLHPPKLEVLPHAMAPAAGESDGFWNQLLDIAEWDFETKRILKLAIPFGTQSLSTGILEMLTLAVIGKLVGTKEVSAYVVVRTMVDISSSFFGGFHESLSTLCAQALGTKNNKLVGQYVQLSSIFYIVCYIPVVVLWLVYMESILLWFGLDAETAQIGKEYTKVYLFVELLDGVDESIHGLLDVIGLESYSTLVGVAHEAITFFDILVMALAAKPSLFVIGLVELVVSIIFISINVGAIAYRGWFDPYREGMLGSCALCNKKAVCQMLSISSSLSVGYLLTDGEWELLTIFASFIGPAEVVAFGILGTTWTALEDLTEAVADASEVRCAFLLGSGQPDRARRSAYKSILIGIFLAFFITSIVFMLGDDLPTWFTNDPALQSIIANLLPLFGVGNITLTMGTLCWTLLGSQGRYRLATIVACISSWFVTLPLAAIFTFALNINLQGLVASLVIGYMVSGTVNAYFLFRSDWNEICRQVLAANDHAAQNEMNMESTSLAPSSMSSNKKDEAVDNLQTVPTLRTVQEGNSMNDSFDSGAFCNESSSTDEGPPVEVV